MNHKQRQFVDLVVEMWPTVNYSRAYRDAGYACRDQCAGPAASRLLRNVHVKGAIEAGIAAKKADMEAAKALVTTQQYDALPLAAKQHALRLNANSVLQELACIAFSDPGEALDSPFIRSMPEHARRAIASIKVKRYIEGKGEGAKPVEEVEIRYWDKNAAISNLIKALGMLKDKTPIERLLADLHAFNPELAAELKRLLIKGHVARKARDTGDEPNGDSSEITA